MPELPDVTVYVEALRPRIVGRTVARLSIRSPFLVRTFDPPVEAAQGRTVTRVERLGKRIVFALDNDLFIALHLMIAGRLLWRPPGSKPTGKIDLAALEFSDPPDLAASPCPVPPGTLVLTEASTSKRAALHVLRSHDALAALAPVGLDVFACSTRDFAARLASQNRTLKRALTSPSLFDGIGNAYSDEILWEARLSPVKLTSSLSDDEAQRLHDAARSILAHWTDELRTEFGLVPPNAHGRFPAAGEITAFRPGFAVHGKYGLPCRRCGHTVARIVRAENEINYCPTCQTGGKLLADRLLSRLLKDDWPTSVEQWESG